MASIGKRKVAASKRRKPKSGGLRAAAKSWLGRRKVKKAAKKVVKAKAKKQKAVNKGYKKRAKQSKRNVKKINKMVIKSEKKKAGSGMKRVKLAGVAKRDPSKISAHGKIRRGMKSVTMTGGGAFASYKKKSRAAGSFRKSFAAASKAGKKTFTWDGRSYTTKKKAAPKKKKP
jgi:hypothetical protein